MEQRPLQCGRLFASPMAADVGRHLKRWSRCIGAGLASQHRSHDLSPTPTETNVEITETVRECDVFILQSGCGKVNDTCMELFILAQAARTASAHR